jgi:two-component system, cell cycle sensor histidine kinase and response regulator CckA
MERRASAAMMVPVAGNDGMTGIDAVRDDVMTDRLRNTLAASMDVVVLIDGSGRILEVGPSMEHVFGHRPQSLVGRSCFDLVHPDDSLLTFEGLGHAAQAPGRRLEHQTARVADASGAWRPVEVVARNLLEDPAVGGIVITLRDRSGVAEVEREIAEREDRYRQIAELALEGVWYLDQGSRTTFVTQRMAAMLGHAPEDMVGRPLWDFIDAADLQMAEELLSRRRRGVREEHTFRFVHRTGRSVWTRVSATPVQGPDGSFRGAIALVSDVSEQRDAEQRLAETEARERAILHALPDLMFRVRGDGRVLEHRSGRDGLPSAFVDQLVGRWLQDMLPDDVVAAAQRAIDEALSTGMVTSFSYDHVGAEDTRHYEARLSSVGHDDVVILVRDVTDIRRAERDRQEYLLEVQRREAVEQRAELERGMARAARLEALGRLAGGVAHDMNNLLGVIANYAAAIRQSTHEEVTVTDVMEIERVVRRGTQLTKRLLLFGRRDGAASDVQDLVRITSGVCGMLARTIGPLHELRVDLHPEPLWVAVDRWQFEQAVINLVINARDAGPDGTPIVVTVRPDGEHVTVAVSDEGPGMSPETQERVFEPFFTTKPAGHGTGLGLAVVHGVAVEAGGSVRIDSSPGTGTTVTIVLPAVGAPADVDGPTEDAPVAAQALRSGRLLVVDDEEDVRRSMTRLLEARGFHVEVVGSGDQALSMLSGSAQIDAVVSDVVMPGLTGPVLARRLRDVRPGLPVVLLTGYGADLVDDLPVDVPLLPKPLVIDDLVHTLSGLLTA